MISLFWSDGAALFDFVAASPAAAVFVRVTLGKVTVFDDRRTIGFRSVHVVVGDLAIFISHVVWEIGAVIGQAFANQQLESPASSKLARICPIILFTLFA